MKQFFSVLTLISFFSIQSFAQDIFLENAKFRVGDDASWAEYIETAKSMGYEQLVEVQQAAYDRLINKN